MADWKAVAQAVAAYVNARGLLLDQADAHDQCYTESTCFLEALAAAGVDAALISGLRMDGNIVLNGHFAVVVDNEVWDWTYRQFDPECPVPLITPIVKWRDQWVNSTVGPMPAETVAG